MFPFITTLSLLLSLIRLLIGCNYINLKPWVIKVSILPTVEFNTYNFPAYFIAVSFLC